MAVFDAARRSCTHDSLFALRRSSRRIDLGWRRRIDRDGDDLPADRWLIAAVA